MLYWSSSSSSSSALNDNLTVFLIDDFLLDFLDLFLLVSAFSPFFSVVMPSVVDLCFLRKIMGLFKSAGDSAASVGED